MAILSAISVKETVPVKSRICESKRSIAHFNWAAQSYILVILVKSFKAQLAISSTLAIVPCTVT